MDTRHALHGHASSMSSIATTVVPLTFDPPLSSPLSDHEKMSIVFPEEAWIPLPPSPSERDPRDACNETQERGEPHGPLEHPVAVSKELERPQEQIIDNDSPITGRHGTASTVGDKSAIALQHQSDETERKDHEEDDRQESDRETGRTRSLVEQDRMNIDPVAIPIPESVSGQESRSPANTPGDFDGQETPTQGTAPPFPLKIDSLLDTFRRNRDEAQRCFALRRKVNTRLRQAGSQKRAIPALHHRSRQLVECLHKDRATTFSSLYSEAEDKAVQTDPVESSQRQDEDTPFLNNATSWTSHISQETEDSLLSMLNNIRVDEAFLADRIASLPHAHLNYLSRLHRSSAGSEPDLIHPSKGSPLPHTSRPPSRFSIKPDTFENISDLRRDPLQLLVHGVWDCQGEVNALECHRRSLAWSSVCAKLISKSAPGADNFCVAVLNEFAIEESWKLRPQIEMLLLAWIQNGVFITDPQSAPYQDGESEDARRTRMAADEPRFIDNAVLQLLELLTRNEHAFMPSSCLDLIRATLSRIPEVERRQKAQGYFVLVWYCQAFLSEALLSPELLDLLPQHYVNVAVRQRLLRGIWNRLQKTIATVLSSSQNSVLSQRTTELTRELIGFFEPSQHELDPNEVWMSTAVTPSFLMLRRSDVLSICGALFPNINSAPDPTPSSFFGRTFGLPFSASAATSVGTITPMAGTTSSLAPSTSSTSITSDTFFTNPFVCAETTSFTINNVHPQPLTPKNLPGDDSQYVVLARQLQGIAASPEMQQIRKGPDAAGALFFVKGGRISLAAPQPANSPDLHSDFQPPWAAELDSLARPTSLYDMLESCLVALAVEPSIAQRSLKSSASVTDCLTALVKEKAADSQARLDFQAAHTWYRAVAMIEGSPGQTHSVLAQLSASIDARNQAYDMLSSMYHEWLSSLVRRSRVLEIRLTSLATIRRTLRDKMWFSDVRHSKIYEEAALVSRALATMGNRQFNSSKQQGIGAWARKKFKVFGPERAEAKTLSELSAGKDRGGRSKLNDQQAESTEQWLVKASIENFCQGEERIQRFCLEISRAVDRLVGETAVASPSLWSSVLFARERAEFGGIRSKNISLGLGPISTSQKSAQSYAGSAVDGLAMSGSSRIFPFTLSPPHSRHASNMKDSATAPNSLRIASHKPGILDPPVKYNTYAHKHMQPPPENSLGLYASWPLPPSPISPTTTSSDREQLSPHQRKFLDDLRRTVTSFLLSDLGTVLWATGSETDNWIRGEMPTLGDIRLTIASKSSPDLTKLVSSRAADLRSHETLQKVVSPVHDAGAEVSPGQQPQTLGRFPYEDAYDTLLLRLRLSMDPHTKLESLYELVRLAAVAPTVEHPRTHGPVALWPFPDDFSQSTEPRTGLTRLQVVTANCEERRVLSKTLRTDNNQTTPSKDSRYSTIIHRPAGSQAGNDWLAEPHIMTFVQALLMDRRFYPADLFRDLQFIAAFVPATILDATPQGTAFWMFGLAAMQLKSALTAGMVDRAGQILAHHYERDTREPIRNESRGNSPQLGSEETSYGIQGGKVYRGKMTSMELEATSLNDAARLYALAALEGDPTAARELGLFYLTKPEIVKRVTLPLSKPSEIFRNVPYPGAANNGEGKHNGNGRYDAMDIDGENTSVGSSTASGGLEPAIFAIALHWMEFAADAGDPDATTFLNENGDFKRE